MKNYFLFLILLVSLNSFGQEFKDYLKQAQEDYKNEKFKSTSFDDALKTCPDIKKYPELLLYKGISLEFNGENLLAVKYIKIALNYIKSKEDLYECHSFLAFAYSSSDNLEKAVHHYEVAIDLGEELNNKVYVYENEFNLLLIEYDVAKDKKIPLQKMLNSYYLMPKELGVDIKLSYMSMLVDLSKGELLQEDYKKLKETLKTSFNVKKLTKDFQGQYYNSNAILESFIKNYDAALKYCDSSYFISKNYLYKENMLNDFYTYKEIYQQLNKPELALQYVDSILKIEESYKIQELESGIALVDENILYEKIIEQTKFKKNVSLWAVIIVFLLLLLFYLYDFFFNKKKSKIATHSFEKKYNNLWSDYQLSIKQLERLKEELNKNKINNNKEINEVLKEVNLLLNSNTQDAHKHVNLVKNNFIKSLTKEAPYLNDQEQLICFFITLEFPHKKIGELLNKTEKSIDSYKYRINGKVKKHHNISVEELCGSLKTTDLNY